MGFLTTQAAGERDVLVAFLGQQFAQARSAVYGLSDEALRLVPTASAFSLGALLIHLAQVADSWGGRLRAAPEVPEAAVRGTGGDVEDWDDRGALLERYDAAVAEALQSAREVDLDVLVPRPEAPWFPADLLGWQARWVVQHMIAEVARHAGHADILRESIDGKISYELNARADGALADDEEFPGW